MRFQGKTYIYNEKISGEKLIKVQKRYYKKYIKEIL